MPTSSLRPHHPVRSRADPVPFARRLENAVARLLTLAAVSAFPPTPGLAAQEPTAGLRAVVTASDTDRPVAGAVVRVGGADGKLARTDGDGRVRVGGVRPGVRAVTVEAFGYVPERVLLAFEPFTIVDAAFTLAADPIPLEPIGVAVARRSRTLEIVGFYERVEMRTGTFLTPEQAGERAARAFQLSDMLRGLGRIRIVRIGSRHAVVSRRGIASIDRTIARRCRPRIWLDGVRLGDWASGDIDRVVSPSAVAAVEVYGGPSETPIEFDPTGGACGTILIWTGARPG